MGIQGTFSYTDLICFVNFPENTIVGSYGRYIFSFLIYFHRIFFSGFGSLHFHQEILGYHILDKTCYFFNFGWQPFPSEVITISLRISVAFPWKNDPENFLHLLPIYMSSCGNCLLMIFAHFSTIFFFAVEFFKLSSCLCNLLSNKEKIYIYIFLLYYSTCWYTH